MVFWLRKPEQKYLIWVSGGNKRKEKAAWERQTGKLINIPPFRHFCHPCASPNPGIGGSHVEVWVWLMSQIFPCNELGGLPSLGVHGTWAEKSALGKDVTHQLLGEKARRFKLKLQIKALRLKVRLCRSYLDETPHHL